MTLDPDFKVPTLSDSECLGNGTRYRHSYHGTYTLLLKGVISNDME